MFQGADGEIESFSSKLRELKAGGLDKLSLDLRDVKTETQERVGRLEKGWEESSRRNSERFLQLEKKHTGEER